MDNKNDKRYIKINYLDGTSEGHYMLSQYGNFVFYHDLYLDFKYDKTKDEIIEMVIPYIGVKNFMIENT